MSKDNRNDLDHISKRFIKYIKQLKKEENLADYESAFNMVGHCVLAIMDSDPLSQADIDFNDDDEIIVNDGW